MTKIILSLMATAILAFGLGWLASSQPAEQPAARLEKGAFGPAVREALREASPAVRTRNLANLFDAMTADQIDEAVAVYDREINFIANFEIELLFEAWARHDPFAALAHAEGLRAPLKRQAAVEATIRSWATHAPLAAREVVTKLLEENPTLRQPSLANLVVGWVQSGQPGVASYVAGLSEPYQMLGSVALAGAQARRLGSADLARWADSVLLEIENAEFEEGLFGRVVKAIARRDPAAAAAWVDRHADADYAVQGYRLAIEFGLAGDPDTMIAWSGHADPEKRQKPISFAAKRWLDGDFAAASNYIESAALTPLHDPFVAEYAAALFRKSEWLRSIDWAERIVEQKLRDETLQRTALVWLRNDPTAAELWLGQSPLEETAREQVREAAARPAPAKRGNRQPRRPGARAGK